MPEQAAAAAARIGPTDLPSISLYLRPCSTWVGICLMGRPFLLQSARTWGMGGTTALALAGPWKHKVITKATKTQQCLFSLDSSPQGSFSTQRRRSIESLHSAPEPEPETLLFLVTAATTIVGPTTPTIWTCQRLSSAFVAAPRPSSRRTQTPCNLLRS